MKICFTREEWLLDQIPPSSTVLYLPLEGFSVSDCHVSIIWNVLITVIN